MTDGSTPRIPKPDNKGKGWPGTYIGWEKVKDDKGEFVGYEETGETEDVVDCHMVRRAIREGHLEVMDASHELFGHNEPDPRAAKKSQPKPKASDKKTQKDN
jgi:hypothetical protein